MKIGKGDLDQSLVQKIERLDGVVEAFSTEGRPGFLSYNGEGFVARSVNESALRRVFSESELASIESHLYDEGSLVRNSFRSNFNKSNQAAMPFRSLLVRPSEETLFKSDSPIVLSSHNKTHIVFVNKKGIMVKLSLSSGETVGAVDIIKDLRSNFAVQHESAFDFMAIELYGDGVLLSTASNGVLYYDFSSKKLEVKFAENGVTIIRNLGNGVVMCAADRIDANVMFFSFETGMKTESSNALKRGSFQNPVLSDFYNDHLFVVGRPYASNTSIGTLHYWRRDKGGISFKNEDRLVFRGLDYVNHSAKHILLTEDNVYLSGLRGDGTIFVWQYDLKDISSPFREISLAKFPLKRIDFIDFSDEFIVAGEGKSLYFLRADGSVEKNLLLSREIGNLFFTGEDSLVHVSGNEISRIKLPKYSDSGDITLDLYSSETPCNNIDVIVKGTTGDEKFAFFDTETLSQIAPFYLASFGGRTMVKISGSQSKSISMKISVKPGSQVEGVAVRADRLFLK
jgi:hypothetical protein